MNPILMVPPGVMSCSDGDWDFYWCDVGWMKEYFDHYYMEEHMKISHFRNHYEVPLSHFEFVTLLHISAPVPL